MFFGTRSRNVGEFIPPPWVPMPENHARLFSYVNTYQKKDAINQPIAFYVVPELSGNNLLRK